MEFVMHYASSKPKSLMKYNHFAIKIIFMLSLIPLSLSGQNRLDDQGNKTGSWKVYYPDSSLRYEAIFDNGIPVGIMKRYNPNGSLSAIMDFHVNPSKCYTKIHGKSGGIIAEGMYINQKKDSIWVYYSSDKSVRLKEYYSEGLLSGTSEDYYHDGNISQKTNYKDGVKNGQWLQFYENGNLMQSANYKNDKLHGIYEAYYPEEQLEISGSYIDDLKDGNWQYYGEDGEKKDLLIYDMGDIQNPEVLQENYEDFLKHVEDNIGNIPDPDDGEF